MPKWQVRQENTGLQRLGEGETLKHICTKLSRCIAFPNQQSEHSARYQRGPYTYGMTNHPLTMKKLYPGLTDAEVVEAENNLDRYVALVLRIFERLETENCPQPGALLSSTGTVRSCTPEPKNSIKE